MNLGASRADDTLDHIHNSQLIHASYLKKENKPSSNCNLRQRVDNFMQLRINFTK